MPTTVITATIPAGDFLSSPVDASTGDPIFVVGPTEWTPANVTFQVSGDGVTFGNWFTWDGREVILPYRPGTALPLTGEILGTKGAHIKLRSGSRDHPVTQEADRVFKFVVAS